MKKYLFAVISFATVCFASPDGSANDFKQCRVSQDTTMPRFVRETIKAGWIAVTSNGTPADLTAILKDSPIFFKSESGKLSQTYQWFYSGITQVPGLPDKYFCSVGVNEDAIITVRTSEKNPSQTIINYFDTVFGNYLNLICE